MSYMDNNHYFNVKFIALVKERPCLYERNRSEQSYYIRELQDAAWKEVAQHVEGSIPECKERWKNIRSSYGRYVKNMMSKSPKRVKKYYLAKYLQFLKPLIKPKRRGLFMKEEPNIADQNTESEYLEESLESDTSTTYPVEIETYTKSYSKTDQLTNRKDTVHNDTASEVEYFQIDKNDDSGNQDLETFNQMPNKRSRTRNDTNEIEYFQVEKNDTANQDPDYAFLYSLLPDFKEMNREQKRKFKVGVLKLADTILNQNKSNGDCDPFAE